MTREDYPMFVILVAVVSAVLCLLFLAAGAGLVAVAFPVAAAVTLIVGWWMQ